MRLIHLSGLVILGTFLSATTASAQSSGPEEAVEPNGAVVQNLALTAAQRQAILNAVLQQPAKRYPVQVAAAVGAAVPQTVDLTSLPDGATAGDPAAANLKYAVAENDAIVVVDPVQMRVVDVIHNHAKH